MGRIYSGVCPIWKRLQYTCVFYRWIYWCKKVNEKLAFSQTSETNYYQEVMLVSEGSFCYRANGLIWSNTLLVEY